MTSARSPKKSPKLSSRKTASKASATTAWRDGPPIIDPVRRTGIALWRQIAEDIEMDIETGKIAAGERLSTEKALAEHYGVNRHTLRRAIGELANKGLVEATPGRGTFVRGARIAYPIGGATRFSEVIAGSGREPGGTMLSHAVVEAPDAVAAQLELEPGAAVVALEHLRDASGMPICLATNWFPADRFAGIGEAYARSGTITEALAACGVRKYRRRRTRISSRTANSEEREYLHLNRGAIVLVIDSVNVDAKERPIQSGHSRFAADRVQLIVEN